MRDERSRGAEELHPFPAVGSGYYSSLGKKEDARLHPLAGGRLPFSDEDTREATPCTARSGISDCPRSTRRSSLRPRLVALLVRIGRPRPLPQRLLGPGPFWNSAASSLTVYAEQT